MKILLLFLIFNIFSINILLANEEIYETKFYNIDINSNIILESRNQEINRIKILSLKNILYKILSEQNYKKLLRKVNLNEVLNYLIKNIIIEDEFISNNKYKAKIKVNFDRKSIIDILRNNKINYTDMYSPIFLFITAEKSILSEHGLSLNNNFYNSKFSNKFQLFRYQIPDLSTNDRYILPYTKILDKDSKSLNKISNKYNVRNIIIILIETEDKFLNFNLDSYSSKTKKIKKIGTLKFKQNEKYHGHILNFLNNWWKEKNFIDNKLLNQQFCSIKNSNIYELQYINSKINLLSQVKSNKINQISFGSNTHDIIFYGSMENLLLKLLNENINIEITSNSECIISVNK